MIEKDKGIEAIIFTTGAVLMLAVLILWAGFWSGLTFSYLWGWFVVPVFHLPALSISAAYGLVLTAFALQHRPSNTPQKNQWKLFAMAPVHCGLTLLVGYILFHAFIN